MSYCYCKFQDTACFTSIMQFKNYFSIPEDKFTVAVVVI